MCTRRNATESFSNGRKMIPDGNKDIQEGMKGIRNGKYVSKHNRVFFLLLSLKNMTIKTKIIMYYGVYNVQ